MDRMDLTKVKVTKAYNGQRGCMCGCNGNYVKSGLALIKRIQKVNSFVGPMRPDHIGRNDQAGYSQDGFGGEYYVFVNGANRTTCVYFSKG
jgi:hypothetical protein